MRRVAPIVLLVTAALLISGCGSDAKSSSSANTSQSPAPEQVTTDAATVATGLTRIKGIAASLVTSISDSAKAKEIDGQIEPIWQTVEGTVKKNDPDTYIALEDAYAVLEGAASDGDATKAAAGSASVAAAITAYLAKHPA